MDVCGGWRRGAARGLEVIRGSGGGREETNWS